MLPTLAERHDAVVHQIGHLRRIEPTRVVVGVNSVTLARLAGEHADGVNIRLSSPNAPRYLEAARTAAGDKPFDCSGWANVDDEASQERAYELGLDRLILLRMPID